MPPYVSDAAMTELIVVSTIFGVCVGLFLLLRALGHIPAVKKWAEEGAEKYEREKKEKEEEKRKKKAIMKANARKTKKKDLRYLGACGYIAVHGC